jgi:putative endonuclease
MADQYCVYILTNQRHTVLYTGVTSDLKRRVYQHRKKLVPGFTHRYNVSKLVYFECANDPTVAIAREKQIKAGSRRRKIELVNNMNPGWRELYYDI